MFEYTKLSSLAECKGQPCLSECREPIKLLAFMCLTESRKPWRN